MIRLVLGLWVRVKVMVTCRVMTRVRVSVMDWVRVMVSVRDSVRQGFSPAFSDPSLESQTQKNPCFRIHIRL